MPTQLQTFITNGYSDGGYAATAMQNARNHIFYAGQYIGSQDWILAQDQMTYASDDIGLFIKHLLADDVFYKGLRRDWRDALQWINDNWPDGGGCTMDDILNAMLSATNPQFTKFIGIVDAYRVALWNAPFNVDFYAALARGFAQWL